MSRVPETDVELLRCAPPVDITLFPDAQANRIAQDFGRCLPFIYLDIILTAFSFIYGQIRENISKYIFFSTEKVIQATGRFRQFLVDCILNRLVACTEIW